MAKLFKITNLARNAFYVVAADEVAAQTAYESWVATSVEAPQQDVQALAVFAVSLVAADTAAEDPNSPWATLVS